MVIPTLAAVLLLTVAQAPAQEAPKPPDFDALFAQAMDLHQAGDLVGAIQAYTAALQLQPDRADARSNLGAAFVKLGRFSEAIEQYRQAIAVDPSNPAFRFNLGLAYYKAARHAEAAPEFEAVVRAQRDNKQAVLLLADSLLQAGEYQRVIDLLILRDADFADDLAFGYILGTALVRKGHRDQAQVYLDRIFRAGASAEGHLLMATVHMDAKDYATAIAELQRALDLNPTLPTARSLYGRALLGSGDHDGAVRELQRAVAENPNDFEANLQLGALRRRDNRNEEALPFFQRAVRLRPQDPQARFGLAGAQLAVGNTNEARALLEQVVAEAPSFTEAHVMLASAYYRLKRKEDGDRHRGIAERLRAERQEREPKPGGGIAPDVTTGGAPPSSVQP